MRRALLAVVLAQCAIAAGLVVWWLRREPEVPPVLSPIINALDRKGPEEAVRLLGEDVLRASTEACHHEACVAAIFNGDRARWRAAAQAGADRCAGYQHPGCTRERAARELVLQIRRASLAGCREVGHRAGAEGPVIRVECGGIADEIPLARGGGGGWVILGVSGAPGFLARFSARFDAEPDDR